MRRRILISLAAAVSLVACSDLWGFADVTIGTLDGGPKEASAANDATTSEEGSSYGNDVFAFTEASTEASESEAAANGIGDAFLDVGAEAALELVADATADASSESGKAPPDANEDAQVDAGPNGDPCTGDAQCQSGFCPMGFPPNAGSCQPAPCQRTGTCGVGESCAQPTDCSNGNCLAETCCPATGTCTPLWTVVGTQVMSACQQAGGAACYQPNFVGLAAFPSGDVIYVGTPSNITGGAQQFFGFSFSTGAWASLPVNADVCLCGYTGVFIGTPLGLNHTGNESEQFDGAAWLPLPYTTAAQRGESATTAIGSVVYRIGGRGANSGGQSMVASFDVSMGQAGAWDTTYASAPAALEEGCAGADPATQTIYAFSGVSNPQSGGSLLTDSPTYEFDVDQNAWTTLPATSNTITNCFMATAFKWNGGLVMASNGNLYTFDLTSKAWSMGPQLPGTSDYGSFIALPASDGHLYVVGYSTTTSTVTVYKWWQ
jgi:hypothetical protein